MKMKIFMKSGNSKPAVPNLNGYNQGTKRVQRWLSQESEECKYTVHRSKREGVWMSRVMMGMDDGYLTHPGLGSTK